MKEVIIRYEDSKTLDILKGLARYFGFSISIPKKKNNAESMYEYINGVPVIPGDRSVDIDELATIFTAKNIDSRKLRKEEWRRHE